MHLALVPDWVTSSILDLFKRFPAQNQHPANFLVGGFEQRQIICRDPLGGMSPPPAGGSTIRGYAHLIIQSD
jgi:hypothetical protein